jgi:hypothetical protein
MTESYVLQAKKHRWLLLKGGAFGEVEEVDEVRAIRFVGYMGFGNGINLHTFQEPRPESLDNRHPSPSYEMILRRHVEIQFNSTSLGFRV